MATKKSGLNQALQIKGLKKLPQTREGFLWLVLFLVTILGGAVRKWFTTSGAFGNVILLVQMLLPFLMYSLASHKAKNPFKYYPVLTFYFLYLFFQVINPLQPTFFHGILGVIVHGMFWIGIFFYFANRHLFNLQKYFVVILLLVGLELVLAFIQYGLPQTHFLNKYAHEAVENIAVVGDRVRVTGTFSYLSGYTAFLLFYPFFVWALIFQRAATWLVFTLALAGLVASFMTGSRSGVLLYLILNAFALIENYRISDIAPLLGKIILPLLIIISIFLVVKGDEVGSKVVTAYENFSYRVTALRERGEEAQRLTWDFRYFSPGRFQYPVFGIGTGSTYQGAIILFGVSRYAQQFGYVESEFVKIVLEGGWLLLILKFLIAGLAVQQLCFGSTLFKFTLWGMLVYAAPIVFNVHNGSFLLLGLILVDNINWQRQHADKALLAKNKVALQQTPVVMEEKAPDFGYPQVFR